MSKAAKKSKGGAAKGPSTKEPEGTIGEDHGGEIADEAGEQSEETKSEVETDLDPTHDPQKEYEERVKENPMTNIREKHEDPREQFVSSGNDAEDALHEGDQAEEALVRVKQDKTNINGHVMKDGTVIKMAKDDIHHHRHRGVGLEAVAADYDGDVYDVSEPFVAEEEKEKA